MHREERGRLYAVVHYTKLLLSDLKLTVWKWHCSIAQGLGLKELDIQKASILKNKAPYRFFVRLYGNRSFLLHLWLYKCKKDILTKSLSKSYSCGIVVKKPLYFFVTCNIFVVCLFSFWFVKNWRHFIIFQIQSKS